VAGDSLETVTRGVAIPPLFCNTIRVKQRNTIMWDEIQDMPGEIFDIEDFNEMKKELFELIEACIELEEAN